MNGNGALLPLMMLILPRPNLNHVMTHTKHTNLSSGEYAENPM